MKFNEIRVAIAGVGNLASGLIQGIEYYSLKTHENKILNSSLAGFRISDIELTAAFDVGDTKVGEDLSKAIFAPPNNTPKSIDVPKLDVVVQKAPVFDGISDMATKLVNISSAKECNITDVLSKTKTDVLVLATPSGATKIAEHFTQAALDAQVALINTTPAPLARSKFWARKFKDAKIPLLGDDLQSQAGGTIFHKGLIKLLQEIGVFVTNTYQLDVSGGLEGLTTLDFNRRKEKRLIKEESISRAIGGDFNITSGTTDYLDFLGSLRIGHYWIEGKGFLNQPVKIDIRTESMDGSNGAAALIDAIRIAKIALARIIGGPIEPPASYLFKAPPVILSPEKSKQRFYEFVNTNNCNCCSI